MKKIVSVFLSIFLTIMMVSMEMSSAYAAKTVADDNDVIHMFICYGQSWSTGYDASAITTEARYDNLMLDTGIMTDPLSDLDAVATSFLPAVEKTQTAEWKKGETPVSAQMNMVQQLLAGDSNTFIVDLTYTMLGTAPGYGSKTLAQLKKGTDYYTRLVAQVQQANDIATAMGKRLVVQAFSWVQGSIGNYPKDENGKRPTYAEALEQLRQDIDTDVKSITGQTEVVKCITWQSFIYNTSLRAKQVYDQYVGAAQTYPHIICAGATYHLNNVRVANLHLNSESQDWLGAYFGVAYKHTIIDGEKFEPLQPIGSHIEGNSLYIKFHVPYGSLVFDGDYFAGAINQVENEGFELFAVDGAEKVITDVSIVSSDVVKIQCAEAVLGTDRLTYGDISTDAYQWVNVNRGHLRDTQGDVLQYKSGNLGDTHSVLPLHNWCVLFDKVIDELEHFETPPAIDPDDATGTTGATETYRYRVMDGKATIMEWLDTTSTEAVIPSVIDAYPVVAIDAWAFAPCDRLTTITIPESVTVIGANAFYRCDNLTDVFYTGNMPAVDAIVIGENNDALTEAVWHSPSDRYSSDVVHSVMDTDKGNGLAFRFELYADNVSTVRGNQVNLANATIEYLGADCKLIGLGALVTNDASVGEGNFTLEAVNGWNVRDVPTVYMQDVTANTCAFATRVINIPSTAWNRTVYARPYYIVEKDGAQIIVYGNVDSAACADFM